MKLDELKNIVRNSGIVGAGGAGFPTYMKLDERAETIIMNCAECEPLLRLHRQLLRDKAQEILKIFAMLADTVHAKEAVIGIKESYQETIEAVEAFIGEYPGMRIQKLPETYPMGDEVVLIYEATGKVIRPGGLPIEEGVAVFNVETVYNIYRAVEEQMPVMSKYVTIVGEVAQPVTVRMPLYTGDAIQNQVRETVALQEKARNDLEAARRGVTQATRQLFLG
ncbi:MAG TPA: TolC family protein, partial [Lachnospiraceae bacterium]|nr:TolC family protein [Lachnospiraceae bacterium]